MAREDQENSKNFMGLRFDNHVSFGHIITTISIIILGIAWVISTDARLHNLEKFDLFLEKKIDNERIDRKSDMGEIKEILKDIKAEIKDKADK